MPRSRPGSPQRHGARHGTSTRELARELTRELARRVGAQSAHGTSAHEGQAHGGEATPVHGTGKGKGKAGKGKGRRGPPAPEGTWSPDVQYNEDGLVVFPESCASAKDRKAYRERVRKRTHSENKMLRIKKSPPRFILESQPPPVCNRCGVMWKEKPQVIVCVQKSFCCLGQKVF